MAADAVLRAANDDEYARRLAGTGAGQHADKLFSFALEHECFFGGAHLGTSAPPPRSARGRERFRGDREAFMRPQRGFGRWR
jgi:hypothetical protein